MIYARACLMRWHAPCADSLLPLSYSSKLSANLSLVSAKFKNYKMNKCIETNSIFLSTCQLNYTIRILYHCISMLYYILSISKNHFSRLPLSASIIMRVGVTSGSRPHIYNLMMLTVLLQKVSFHTKWEKTSVLKRLSINGHSSIAV